jgi:hypothetical protein
MTAHEGLGHGKEPADRVVLLKRRIAAEGGLIREHVFQIRRKALEDLDLPRQAIRHKGLLAGVFGAALVMVFLRLRPSSAMVTMKPKPADQRAARRPGAAGIARGLLAAAGAAALRLAGHAIERYIESASKRAS